MVALSINAFGRVPYWPIGVGVVCKNLIIAAGRRCWGSPLKVSVQRVFTAARGTVRYNGYEYGPFLNSEEHFLIFRAIIFEPVLHVLLRAKQSCYEFGDFRIIWPKQVSSSEFATYFKSLGMCK